MLQNEKTPQGKTFTEKLNSLKFRVQSLEFKKTRSLKPGTRN